jgi:hypothetical protein
VTESPSCICINNTRTRYYSFDHMDDLCQRCPLTLSNVYIYCNNIWVNEFFLDKQHRHIAAAILSLTSTTDIFASLAFCQMSFYQEEWWLIHMLSLSSIVRIKSIARESCNALLESNLNHILTTKHLNITVG